MVGLGQYVQGIMAMRDQGLDSKRLRLQQSGALLSAEEQAMARRAQVRVCMCVCVDVCMCAPRPMCHPCHPCVRGRCAWWVQWRAAGAHGGELPRPRRRLGHKSIAIDVLVAERHWIV